MNLTTGVEKLSNRKMQYNYSKGTVTGTAKSIRIIIVWMSGVLLYFKTSYYIVQKVD
jgi:hypothetical protein